MTLVTPARSFLAGLLLLVPVHLSPDLTGSPYGISGALHRSVTSGARSWTAVAGTGGLLVGGAIIGWLLPGPEVVRYKITKTSLQWMRWVVSGLLVGAGSKLANGCTSGHMLSGLTRLSPRSLVATALFFVFGGLTASLFPDLAAANSWASPAVWDWSVGPRGWFLTSTALFAAVGATIPSKLELSRTVMPAFLLSLSFAFSLANSGMLSPSTILAFLTPFGATTAWNPSLLFLAGVLPLSVLFYKGSKPARDREWAEPELWIGAALFGVGWGLSGVCPGPALVNLGTSIALDVGVRWWAAWVGASVAGGKLAGLMM